MCNFAYRNGKYHMKKYLITLITIIIIIIASIALFRWSELRAIQRNIVYGNEIIQRIKQYVAENGTLPYDLAQIGLNSQIGFNQTDTEYTTYKGVDFWYLEDGCGDFYLYFALNAEENMIYYSAENDWSDDYYLMLCD